MVDDKAKTVARPGVITNPTPAVDENVPPPTAPVDPKTLPLSTQREMATGAAALKKQDAPIFGSGDLAESLPKPDNPDGGVGEGKHKR